MGEGARGKFEEYVIKDGEKPASEKTKQMSLFVG